MGKVLALSETLIGLSEEVLGSERGGDLPSHTASPLSQAQDPALSSRVPGGWGR